MACGCPSEQCTCFLNGDAFTGGNGSAATPYTVENLPFAPTSPTNSVTITPGGVKNHTPAIDVALSSDPNNLIQYDVDGLLVDPCDAVDTVATENALTCGPDGLLVDRCDIVTATQQAVGDIVILGPGCTTQRLADPAAVNNIIAAQAGQWGQRPLLSADGGNASSIGTDGGIFSPSFGAAAPTYGVQFFAVSGNIIAADGPIVVFNGGGAGQILTLPPAVIGLSFDIYHEGAQSLRINTDAGDTIPVYGGPAQNNFGIPPGVSYRLTALSATTWRAEYMGERYILYPTELPNNALPGCKVRVLWAQPVAGGGAVMGTFETKEYGNTWMHSGGPAAWDADGSAETTLSSVYVALGANNPVVDVYAPGSFHCIAQAQSANNTIQGYTFSAIKPPSAAANDLYEALFCSTIANVTGHSRSGRILVDAAAGIYEMHNRVNFGTGSWTDRRIEILPEYITS